MTFRPKAVVALLAAALALTGCGGVGGSAQGATIAGNAAFVRMLADADSAMARGALPEAARLLDTARSLAPESPDLWVAIARLRLRGGEHLTALEAADRALAFGPEHAPALLLRAVMVRDAHGSAGALTWFAAARKADPGNPDIIAEYAATLGDAGQATAMLNEVRALADVAPGDRRALFLQAVLAARGREYGLARSLLERSGMATRGVPAAHLLDALISLEEGNADSAAVTLESLTARQPANARARELLAHAMLAGGHADDVIRRFGPEAALPEASPYLIMLVARAYEWRGDRVAAASLLSRAYGPIRSGPVVLAVRDGLPPPTAEIRAALLAGNRTAARDQAEALRQRFPASADVASLSGDAWAGAGDLQSAVAAYGLASEARRPWPLARRSISAFRASGNDEAADLILIRQIAGETQNARVLVALAQRFALAQDWGQVVTLLDHAVQLGAGHDPVVLSLRLRAAEALGEDLDKRRFAVALAYIQPRRLAAP